MEGRRENKGYGVGRRRVGNQGDGITRRRVREGGL